MKEKRIIEIEYTPLSETAQKYIIIIELIVIAGLIIWRII